MAGKSIKSWWMSTEQKYDSWTVTALIIKITSLLQNNPRIVNHIVKNMTIYIILIYKKQFYFPVNTHDPDEIPVFTYTTIAGHKLSTNSSQHGLEDSPASMMSSPQQWHDVRDNIWKTNWLSLGLLSKHLLHTNTVKTAGSKKRSLQDRRNVFRWDWLLQQDGPSSDVIGTQM